MDWKHVGRALRHRNFRLFFFGQGMSLIGTWMQSVAVSWLTYRLTGSAFLLGAAAFLSQAPVFVLSPLAGVIADKRSRHRMLITTQTLCMLQAAALAVLVLTGRITVPWIFALSAFIGFVNAFDIPARQSFIVELVDRRDDLPNALALHSTIFNGARLIGPSIAGILIATVGEGPCFAVNALSFIPILLALSSMRLAKRQALPVSAPVLKQLRDGFRYAWKLGAIRSALSLLALASLTGMSYTVLMPIVAKELLKGDAHTLGFLVGVSGLGALGGAVSMASLKSFKGLIRYIGASCALFGAALCVFAVSRHLWISMALVLVAGYGVMVQMVSTNTLLQLVVDDDKRGRVMSLYTTALIGVAPFGSLLAGTMAANFGVTRTIFFGGAVCVLAAALYLRRLVRAQADLNEALARKQAALPASAPPSEPE